MHNKLKTVLVNSQAGSGNVFCQYLIKANLECNIKWVNHDPHGFKEEENTVNLFILRDPYACIASSIEILIHDKEDEYVKMFLDNLKEELDKEILDQIKSYKIFLDSAFSLDYLKRITFEFLTETPEKFIDNLSKEFLIPVKPYRINGEQIKKTILLNNHVKTRAPREKSEFRKKVDSAVRESLEMKDLYQEYLVAKAIIQSTENML